MVPIVTVTSAGHPAAARRELISQLKQANAYSIDRAIELVVHDKTEERMLGRLVRRGIVKPGMKGGHWLDQERYRDCRRQELIFVIGAILVATGVMACMWLYAKPRDRDRPRVEMQVVVP